MKIDEKKIDIVVDNLYKDDYVFDMSLDEFKKVVGLTESEG